MTRPRRSFDSRSPSTAGCSGTVQARALGRCLPSGALGRRRVQEHRAPVPARHPPAELTSADPEQALQQSVSQSPWDEQKVLTRYRARMAEAFASPEGPARRRRDGAQALHRRKPRRPRKAGGPAGAGVTELLAARWRSRGPQGSAGECRCENRCRARPVTGNDKTPGISEGFACASSAEERT